MSSLSLYLSSENRLGLLWKFGENVGNVWNGAQSVSIPKISNYENFTFIFEGILLKILNYNLIICSFFNYCFN